MRQHDMFYGRGCPRCCAKRALISARQRTIPRGATRRPSVLLRGVPRRCAQTRSQRQQIAHTSREQAIKCRPDVAARKWQRRSRMDARKEAAQRTRQHESVFSCAAPHGKVSSTLDFPPHAAPVFRAPVCAHNTPMPSPAVSPVPSA